MAVATACGPTIAGPEQGSETGTGTTTGGTTQAAPASTSSADSAASSGESSGAASDPGGFIANEDIGVEWCDLFAQDCPAGYKCVPYGTKGEGYGWNSVGCFEIVEEPAQVNEPCTMTDATNSGIDTCDLGLQCWNVDPETLEGTCHAICSGNDLDPICEDPETFCDIEVDGPLVLCLRRCNPLINDCPRGEGCYSDSYNFTCVPDASEGGGAPGEPCMYINVCTPGTVCANEQSVPDCPEIGCCTSFCDLNEGAGVCLPGQECVPWYERGNTPAGYEDLGVCTLPM